MKATINQNDCAGCELCTLICPEVFKMESNCAVAYSNPVPKAYEDFAREASYDCPVNTIMIV
jgi:ferredoxin